VNARVESGEFLSLPELVDAIDGVLAAPNEKLGEGNGPGSGDVSVLAVYSWVFGREALGEEYWESGDGEGEVVL
jgi:hypothetical protein